MQCWVRFNIRFQYVFLSCVYRVGPLCSASVIDHTTPAAAFNRGRFGPGNKPIRTARRHFGAIGGVAVADEIRVEAPSQRRPPRTAKGSSYSAKVGIQTCIIPKCYVISDFLATFSDDIHNHTQE